MADVFSVADFFIQMVNQSEDDQITNLKLNKLLYYAQGVFLARTGKPLFHNDIEAWPLGPVVPSIYRKYKVCGRNPISSDDDTLDSSIFTEEEFETLLDVMRELGQYTGSKLVEMTHRAGTPWSNAHVPGKSVPIEQEAIRAYFIANPVISIKDKINTPKVSALPLDWYDPGEDAEWESYL